MVASAGTDAASSQVPKAIFTPGLRRQRYADRIGGSGCEP